MVLICLGVILGQAFAASADLSEEDSGNLEGSEFEDYDLDNEVRGIWTKEKCSKLQKKLTRLYKKCMEKGMKDNYLKHKKNYAYIFSKNGTYWIKTA